MEVKARRTALAGALVTVTVGALVLTGCTDSDAGSSSSGGVFTTVDENQTINVNAPLNPYNSTSNLFSGYNEEQLAWSKNSLTDPNDMAPGLAKSWDISDGGNSVTIHLQPNAKWSDGTPVTSKDVQTSVALGIASGGNSPVVTQLIDSKTIKISEPQGASSNSFVNAQLSLAIVPNSFWGSKFPADFWKQAATASDPTASSSAVSAANTEITALGKKLDTVGPKTDISAGPFELARVNPGEAVLNKNKYFFAADKIAPSQAVLKSYSGNEQIWSYLKSGQLDAAPYTATPADVLSSILKVKGNSTVTGVSQVSAALAFNQSVAPFNDVNVRRGIAYSLDRSIITKVGEGTSGKASGPTTGLIGAAGKIFLGDAVDGLNGYQKDLAKATAAFQAAGMKKVNGKWQLANGQPFTVNIQVPNGFSDWVAGGKSITSQLSAEGISSQLNTSADYPTYLSDLAAGKFAVGFWLVALGPGPYPAFQRVYGTQDGWQVSGANVTHSAAGANGNWMGAPETQTLDGQSVNPGKLAAELASASSSQQTQLVKQLATLTNEQLPIIQLWDYENVQFVNNTRFTDFPANNNGILTNSPGVWMQLGFIKKK